MKHYRTSAYRRHQRRRVIQRKLRIVRHAWFLMTEDMTEVVGGRFAKGKVHCSCGMCTMHKQEIPLQKKRARQAMQYTLRHDV